MRCGELQGGGRERGGPGPAFGDGGDRAESGCSRSWGWGKGKGDAETRRTRGRRGSEGQDGRHDGASPAPVSRPEAQPKG